MERKSSLGRRSQNLGGFLYETAMHILDILKIFLGLKEKRSGDMWRKTPPVTHLDGFRAAEIVEACHKSAKEEKEVTLPL
jgi:predicted dehydrogenase